MPPFKDEHILIISPGSQTTLAQLGLPESFTPAKLRVPTRMFPAERKGEWEPYKIREIRRKKEKTNVEATEQEDGSTAKKGDVEMVDVDEADGAKSLTNGESRVEDDDEPLYEEDPNSDEGAVYPLKEGRVTNWPAFLALLSHVHNALSSPFHTPIHTPILLIAQPAWTSHDHELLTQFFFEKFKTPALCIMDSAMAVCYAYGIGTATVIDVGYGKVDITAVSDFVTHEVGRGVAISGYGGEAMTQKLLSLLGPKGWTRDMCEQLKKSNICELFPQGTPFPGEPQGDSQMITNPAAAASTGATESGPGAPRVTISDVDMRDDDPIIKDGEDNDGVLDVASIVASGKTAEFLARKEREKAERAAAKKAATDTANTIVKPVRLPNSKKERNTFWYEERRQSQEDSDAMNENGKRAAEQNGGTSGADPKRQKTPEREAEASAPSEARGGAADGVAVTEETETSRREKDKAARKEEKRRNRQLLLAESRDVLRKEIEVGVERFMAASGDSLEGEGILEGIADGVHRTVLAVEEVGKRGELWDSLIMVGNGTKIRGFKDALVSVLNSKYLISPSSATIFTSELPSNLSTPLATGANTPQPQLPGMSHSSNVNPLLLAATTASNPVLNPAASIISQQHQQHNLHSSHGQTPTSIKLAKIPEYFPEWKDVGFEEASFLGAQVAAKVVFVVDQGISKGFMTRVEYNEVGPSGIHECSL
ncbi:MAG: Actin-like protein arp9 (SWI/SNF complex component arp9) [Geoglossum umbratile]|nr:MAG: Actin-like protein arp9 (SWI/SNF complex component arp9) [Geoglossum umbratile]